MTTGLKGAEGGAGEGRLEEVTLEAVRHIEEVHDLDAQWSDGSWDVTVRIRGSGRVLSSASHESIAVALAAVAASLATLDIAWRGE